MRAIIKKRILKKSTLDGLSNDTTHNSTIIISIGQNCLKKPIWVYSSSPLKLGRKKIAQNDLIKIKADDLSASLTCICLTVFRGLGIPEVSLTSAVTTVSFFTFVGLSVPPPSRSLDLKNSTICYSLSLLLMYNTSWRIYKITKICFKLVWSFLRPVKKYTCKQEEALRWQ